MCVKPILFVMLIRGADFVYIICCNVCRYRIKTNRSRVTSRTCIEYEVLRVERCRFFVFVYIFFLCFFNKKCIEREKFMYIAIVVYMMYIILNCGVNIRDCVLLYERLVFNSVSIHIRL